MITSTFAGIYRVETWGQQINMLVSKGSLVPHKVFTTESLRFNLERWLIKPSSEIRGDYLFRMHFDGVAGVC